MNNFEQQNPYRSASNWPPDFVFFFRSPTTKAIHIEEHRSGKSLCGLLDIQGRDPMTIREIRASKDYEFCLTCQSLKSFW